MHNVIIVGAGGFGREVFNWANDSLPSERYRIKGFLSNKPGHLDFFNLGVGVLGDDETYSIGDDDRFLFAIGDIDAKKRIVGKMKDRGARFISLIHPTAVVARTARLGEGVIVCPFAVVSDSVELGDFATLNYYSSCGHDSKVGRCGILSPYATLNGFAVLEDEVFMGTHSTVAANRRIGYRSKISANSVAMYDIPPRHFVFGVPGKAQKIFIEDFSPHSVGDGNLP